ncbi:peptidase [Advenella sp. S44]|uniref:Peptidase n=1 Tax=Advenella kashmirensis TaxID=310575 RepID=A0A356LB02_9BURK|nr:MULTISPECIES: M67 family metallopeptidase [unclassified Advenella]PJX20358.1 peptidase [Advenella sp. S44]HBP28176.1 peptidase [Advenella kashmirensis]
MALIMNKAVYAQIMKQAQQAHPVECCGMLVAPAGRSHVARCIPMRNVAASEVYFSFDSTEQLRVLRDLDERGEQCIGIYHSHTATHATPSREDIEFANDPDMHYLIVSTWHASTVPFRSFRIIAGSVFEESIHLVAATQAQAVA